MSTRVTHGIGDVILSIQGHAGIRISPNLRHLYRDPYIMQLALVQLKLGKLGKASELGLSAYIR